MTAKTVVPGLRKPLSMRGRALRGASRTLCFQPGAHAIKAGRPRSCPGLRSKNRGGRLRAAFRTPGHWSHPTASVTPPGAEERADEPDRNVHEFAGLAEADLDRIAACDGVDSRLDHLPQAPTPRHPPPGPAGDRGWRLGAENGAVGGVRVSTCIYCDADGNHANEI